MSRYFNEDGSVKEFSTRGAVGGRQEFSVFGWAGANKDNTATERSEQSDSLKLKDAVKSLPKAGTRTGHACLDSSKARPGSSRRQDDIRGQNIFADGFSQPGRKVATEKLNHLQGSMGFEAAGKQTVVKPVVVQKRQDHMQSSVFASAAEDLPARPVSSRKMMQLQGSLTGNDPVSRRPLVTNTQPTGGTDSVGKLWDNSKAVDAPRKFPVFNSARVPPGGKVNITFG